MTDHQTGAQACDILVERREKLLGLAAVEVICRFTIPHLGAARPCTVRPRYPCCLPCPTNANARLVAPSYLLLIAASASRWILLKLQSWYRRPRRVRLIIVLLGSRVRGLWGLRLAVRVGAMRGLGRSGHPVRGLRVRVR